MKSAKEITIKYLDNIREEKENILVITDFTDIPSTKLSLLVDTEIIRSAIEMVNESEGE